MFFVFNATFMDRSTQIPKASKQFLGKFEENITLTLGIKPIGEKKYTDKLKQETSLRRR